MHNEWVIINSVAIRYAVSGKGPKTLLLIHELAGSMNSWDGLVQILPENIRIIRFDMRGAGMSEKITGTLDIDAVVNDAAVGAAIATRFVALKPERCSQLVLVAPALGIPAERKGVAYELCDRIDRDGLRQVADVVLPKAFPEELWINENEKARAVARWLGADPQGYAAVYRMLIAVDLTDDLASINIPVMVLAGRHDPFGTPEIVEKLTSSIKDRNFKILEGGHFMTVQSPAVLADALRDGVLA
jgi:3-oxoadipate enol-lactonase